MRWFGLALLGILVAAAVAFAASRLASQQIGLASEPVSAGDALAPASAAKPGAGEKKRSGKRRQARQPSSPPGEATHSDEPVEPAEPAPEYTEPEPAPEQPSGGHERGGEGADD